MRVRVEGSTNAKPARETPRWKKKDRSVEPGNRTPKTGYLSLHVVSVDDERNDLHVPRG
jgi:hypothetical protein